MKTFHDTNLFTYQIFSLPYALTYTSFIVIFPPVETIRNFKTDLDSNILISIAFKIMKM